MVIFSNSEKRFSLLHAQVNDKCPDSSHSRLKRRRSTKWTEEYDAVFVFKEFYPAVVAYLDQLSESREKEVFGRAMFYVKATTPGFLVTLEVINAILNLTEPVARKLQGRRDGVVVRASASQSVDLVFIPLVESYQKTLKNGIHSFPAWRSAFRGGCGEQAGKFACCVLGQDT